MHTLPQLDYDYAALEPYIDAQTMQIHHTKHHQAYIDKLNAAIQGTTFETASLDSLLQELSQLPTSIQEAVRNHGGGHANHNFFWKILTPKSETKPTGKLVEAIEKKWGSLQAFQEAFNQSALARFGSGWAWLVQSQEGLEIISTPNQDSPITLKKTPIIGIDVWEHAYYLRYQNRRLEYIQAFWNIVNWKEASSRFLA